jgi:cation transport ATPase
MPTETILTRIQRAMMLDARAYEEARDDATFTPYAVAAAVIAVFLAAIGAWLWAETVLDFTPDGWFVDTVILGFIFTVVLFLVGAGVMYVVLTQLLREEIPSMDGFLRVALLGHIGYAVSLLVFIPEIGFAFGILAVAFVYFDTIFGIRAAYPNTGMFNVALAVTIGVLVWAALIPLISDYPDNNFVTGTFVYALTD